MFSFKNAIKMVTESTKLTNLYINQNYLRYNSIILVGLVIRTYQL